jgi:hypothetical protein
MKEVWLLLVVALIVAVSAFPASDALPRVGEVAFDGPARTWQARQWWNPLARATLVLDAGTR